MARPSVIANLQEEDFLRKDNRFVGSHLTLTKWIRSWSSLKVCSESNSFISTRVRFLNPRFEYLLGVQLRRWCMYTSTSSRCDEWPEWVKTGTSSHPQGNRTQMSSLGSNTSSPGEEAHHHC
jgi:hypothetical protein